jgi:hypothetical protein
MAVATPARMARLNDRRGPAKTREKTHLTAPAGRGDFVRQSVPATPDDARRLVETLLRELFQTENSARLHPVREAERLGDAPPARAMLALAAHATTTLDDLHGVAAVRSLPTSLGGLTAGRLFSTVRDRALDLVLTTEKSYRGTLLGLRHGIDLVTLLRDAALAADDRSLADFCDRWLAERVPLLADAASELKWFGRRPERALAPVRATLLARAVRALMTALGATEQALSKAVGP